MNDERIPKNLMLNACLLQHQHAYGTKLQWRDKVRKVLRSFHIKQGSWFHVAAKRGLWRARFREGLPACCRETTDGDQKLLLLMLLWGRLGWDLSLLTLCVWRMPQNVQKKTSYRQTTNHEFMCDDVSQVFQSICNLVTEGIIPSNGLLSRSRCVYIQFVQADKITVVNVHVFVLMHEA